MGYYDEPKNVDNYVRRAAGYDGRALIERLYPHLPYGLTVLELGMGPGVDLDLLSQTYIVTGSDQSAAFLERYRGLNPICDLIQLDALTLETERTFNGIYSNKVLHLLTPAELTQSFERQLELLHEGGIALHSFWAGEGQDEMHGMRFAYYTAETLRDAIPAGFEVVEIESYSEMDQDDSLYLILRKKMDDASSEARVDQQKLMQRLVKVCPVVVREWDGVREILLFRHPHGDIQLVKGTLEFGETVIEGSLRELAEESGITAVTDTVYMQKWYPRHGVTEWHFVHCIIKDEMPEQWTHLAEEDGLIPFELFWHPLNEDPHEECFSLFMDALKVIRPYFDKSV